MSLKIQQEKYAYRLKVKQEYSNDTLQNILLEKLLPKASKILNKSL